ncbi:receptor-type adenylate cyclase, putative [Bodo saltans]|uniref:Receptor-type adenylate cyclase, putative n=1 Tax=Bodo saltans TaxID=75058 RepID=A0A0S4KDX4_BODSA|nr:receptor-type adenylate cyclase, putative [Bodo saltans]|eukprot:CUI11832.1 receptor-type adenylate cyclase, putative [Bodo saltans]
MFSKSGLAVVLVVMAMASEVVQGDSRCDGYTCDLSDTALSNFYDPSECDSFTCTTTCLADRPEYEALLTSLGTGTALRSNTPIYLPTTDWLSAQFPQQIFKILAMEVLGFKTRSAAMADGRSILCCDPTVIWLERWAKDPFPTDLQGSLVALPNGYVGFGGLYVPNYVLETYPMASAYSAYKALAQYKSIFPAANSTPCNETMIDSSGACVDSNRYCSESIPYWPNTTCIDGRYVPPQCVNNSDCQEILFNQPTWDTGFFESVIKNLGLNFTFVYVGASNLFSLIDRYAAERRNFMFYMSGPDAILSKVPSTPIGFPPRTQWCEDTENPDPTLSGGNCTYDNPVLYKTARNNDIAARPDLKRLFESLQLSAVKLQALMALHTSGGGTMNVWNASCEWVRENQAIWSSWIVNTPPTPAASSSAIGLIAGVVGGIGGVLLIGVVLFFLYQRRMAMKSVENAPTAAPLALIFTDVESSTNIWEAFPEMPIAMEMHHALIREVIAEYQCYEVKTIGDSFMIACSSLTDAISVCLAIQRRLFNADWPSSIKYWKGDEETQPGMWNGLRVRAGIHWCQEVKPELDTVHGRYDYYGHDVNVSARVESLAAGGQITMTQHTYKALTEEPDYEMLCEDMHCVPFCTGAELKGVQGTVTLYSLTPVELAGRVFKPIAGTQPCTVDAIQEVASQGSHVKSDSSINVAAEPVAGSSIAVLRKLVEDLLAFLPNLGERDKAMTELLVKGKIVKSADEVKSLKLPRKVQTYAQHVNQSLPQSSNGHGGGPGGAFGMSMRRKSGINLKVMESQDFALSTRSAQGPNFSLSESQNRPVTGNVMPSLPSPGMQSLQPNVPQE